MIMKRILSEDGGMGVKMSERVMRQAPRCQQMVIRDKMSFYVCWSLFKRYNLAKIEVWD